MKFRTMALVTTLVVILFILFVGCGGSHQSLKRYNLKDPVELAEDNIQRVKIYHDMVATLQRDQAAYTKFAQDWNAACQAAGNTIQRDQYGEPGCLPPPAAQFTPPAPATPTPPPVTPKK